MGGGNREEGLAAPLSSDLEAVPCATTSVNAEGQQASFTPGPWRCWEPEREGCKWQIDAASGPLLEPKKIATVHSGSLFGQSRAEANARLIAAAPEMFEALREIEKRMLIAVNRNPRAYNTGALEFAQSALAKATGEAK